MKMACLLFIQLKAWKKEGSSVETHVKAGAEQLGLGIKGVKAACAAIEREIAAGTTPGAVLGVLHEGRTWFYTAGYANPNPVQGQPVPVSEDTLYDCASLTKVAVTLPLILQLIDDGVLTLGTKRAICCLHSERQAKKK